MMMAPTQSQGRELTCDRFGPFHHLRRCSTTARYRFSSGCSTKIRIDPKVPWPSTIAGHTPLLETTRRRTSTCRMPGLQLPRYRGSHSSTMTRAFASDLVAL